MMASARTEARYLMRAGDTVFGNDLYTSRSIQSLFHQQTLNVSDIEHYGLDFPAFADGIGIGPTAVSADGITATSNVLPFGPVNLAFPSIHEDSLQTLTATQTGSFTANYNYRPEAIYGNVPLSIDYPYALQQAISPASLFGGLSLYPEQFDTWWVNSRLKQMNKGVQAAKQTTDETASKPTQTNQTSAAGAGEGGIPLNTFVNDSTITRQIRAPDIKPTLAISYFKSRNASSNPWDMPVIYPGVYDLAGKDGPVFPNPGIGTFSTNGAGSTGASLTGTPSPTKPASAAVNQTKPANATAIVPTVSQPAGNALTYADFNFDATTEQINEMSILERMWRNSHRGGTMGKAYIGDTSAPYWIDPYDRPNDVSMLDEQFYVLQSALNMVVPGTQIMPRFWSLGLV